MNKHEKFIKDSYNGRFGSMCNEWKNVIEKYYPELKPALREKGKWYISLDGRFLHNYQGSYSYGFNWSGNWSNTLHASESMDDFRPATDKEVEEALIKEAKKRGFKEGVRFNSAYSGNIHGRNTGVVSELNLSINIGLHTNNQWVFYKGKWAEIVSEPVKKMTVSEICKELGYNVEIIKD